MVSLKSVINLNLKSSLTLLGLLSAFAAFSLGGCQSGTEGQSVRKERQRQYSEVNHSALLRKYLRDMQEHIKKQWRPLEEDFLKGGVVFFVVNKDGTISDLHVTKSTGSETADERMLTAVAQHYLQAALAGGDELKDMTPDDFVRRVLQAARNPAEVEDIVALCQTAARYRQLQKEIPTRQITPRLLETAIRRVVVSCATAP